MAFVFNPRKRTRLEGGGYSTGRPLTLDMGPVANYRIPARARVRPFRKGFDSTRGYYGRFKRAPRTELKFLDTNQAVNNILVAGNVSTSLCVIPQDDTESGRDGKSVVVKQISCKLNVNSDPNNLNDDRIRFLLVQDMQTNGAIANVVDVLETAAIDSFRNLENVMRFKVLKDVELDLPHKTINTAATTTILYNKGFRYNLKCDIPIVYDNSAASGVIATQRSNGLFAIFIAQAANGTDIQFNTRIRYQD